MSWMTSGDTDKDRKWKVTHDTRGYKLQNKTGNDQLNIKTVTKKILANSPIFYAVMKCN